MIKAIIFDCFGVLTADNWVEFCSTLPKGEMVDTARKLNHQFDAGKLHLKDFIDQVSTVTDSDRAVIENIFIHMPRTGNAELFDYIAELKAKYKIGMLSNIATNWVREEFLSPKQQEMFTAMAFSYEIGATKPDPITYKTIVQRLGVKLNESVFIDDQPRYCDAARELGMQAVNYKNFAQMKIELKQILAAAPNN